MLIALRARYANLPLIHVEHSYSEGFVRRNVKARRRFNSLLCVSYALFNRVVAVSREQANWMTREGVVRSGALHVISSSVDLTPFLALQPASGRGAEIIGAVGRFHAQKGFEDLIRAFRVAAGPAQKLRLFGDGPEAATLRLAANGDERIEFHPFTNDPASAYASCDVIAVPSAWEPYGLVALEARAAGRPVLATPVDGLVDQIEEGCQEVADGSWEAAIAALPTSVTTARIAAARREACAQNARFADSWRDLIVELTKNRSGSAVARLIAKTA
jgi:glycosyltransferase involved in cell wall biosynthesis